MKRLLIVLSIVLCLLLCCIYIFIPENLIISKFALINCNPDATNRTLIENNNWQKWLATGVYSGTAEIHNTGNLIVYKNDTFQISKRLHNSLHIIIPVKNSGISSILSILPLGRDSVALQWQSELRSSANPLVKLQRYREAIGVKQKMADMLNRLTVFLESKENVYGLHIEKTSTTDTFLIATKAVFSSYPTTNDIYSLVNKLQAYAEKKQARETNVPMVNVTKGDSSRFQVMVALPTNKQLPAEGSIFFRRMVPGNFLVSEVVGGNYTINQGEENMHLYITDYKKTSMAIPFQSLVTDRSKQPDSSKWITRIYYPINY